MPFSRFLINDFNNLLWKDFHEQASDFNLLTLLKKGGGGGGGDQWIRLAIILYALSAAENHKEPYV